MDHERVLGEQVGISIPTAIPFEEAILTDKLNVKHIWINLYTLVRNYHGAYDDGSAVDRVKLIKAFIEELYVIKNLASGLAEIHYYLTDLMYLEKTFPLAKLKVPRTPSQLLYKSIEDLLIRYALKEKDLNIIKVRTLLPEFNKKVWLITHHPVDLLSRYSFSDVTLLESHTGELKGPAQWNSKLTGIDKYPNIPFNALTLQVLGDSATLFLSLKKSLKSPLLETARARKWTPATTRDKIINDLSTISDRALLRAYADMLTPKLK